MESIRITLGPREYEALAVLAQRDLRPLPDEARHLLRLAFRRRGLLIHEDRAPDEPGTAVVKQVRLASGSG